MKIWIDVLTPKQLLFFEPIVKRLQKKHVVVCTGRRYRELSNLAKIRGFGLKFVGRHGGKSKGGKLRAGMQRMSGLQRLVERERPDLAISCCSPDAARVSFGLGINHVGFSDTPHAVHQNKLYVPLVQKLLISSTIPKPVFERFGIDRADIVRYDAIDALVITKHVVSKGQRAPYAKGRKTVLVRATEEQASYITKKSNIELILKRLSEDVDAEIVVLCRYAEQIKRLKKKFGSRVNVLTRSYDGKMLLTNADVFVGSGGTMTAESALLGVPTISYNGAPNHVEEYLVKKRAIRREEDPEKIPALVRKVLAEKDNRHAKRAKKLAERMQDPYPVLERTINLFK